MKEYIPHDEINSHAIAPTPRGDGLGESAVYVPQWQEKLGWKLFPNSYTEMPEMPKMKDCLVCYVTVHLSWLDRLRMLVSGKLEVTVKTATENVIGENLTATGVSVRPPAWLDRHNAAVRDDAKRHSLCRTPSSPNPNPKKD